MSRLLFVLPLFALAACNQSQMTVGEMATSAAGNSLEQTATMPTTTTQGTSETVDTEE